jgi:multiple sugar transport system permease protein
MATFEIEGPGAPVVDSTRVDLITPRARTWGAIRAAVAVIVTLIVLIPVIWMIMTAFKPRAASVAAPPVVFFKPSLESFVGLLTRTNILPQASLEEYQKRTDLGLLGRIALEGGMAIVGPSQYVQRLQASVIIAGFSTFASVALGLLAAYAFSRFNIPGKDDWLFFILSTRMLPPVVVTIPIFLMYRSLGLYDTYGGMILLYTVFNLSFSVWLLKGFIDEIPREYEEAALVDGYSRLQAFGKVVLPQAMTGIAAAIVFCLVFAWNEYAFALMVTTENARTSPPFIIAKMGSGSVDWHTIAASTLGFLIPVLVVTFALRKHLLRGVTFGAIRQ